MRTRFNNPCDTHPEIERLMIDGMRQMPAWKKVQMIWALRAGIESVILQEVKQRHPEASERELRLRVASRSLPADLMLKAFGWDVEKQGY